VYEDEDIIVVDKPAGILCLPTELGVASIVETVFDYVQQQNDTHKNESNTDKGTGTISNTPSTSNNENTTTTESNDSRTKTMDTQQQQPPQRVHIMDQMIVHRLGYDTAGLLLMAKTIPAVRALNLLFRTRPTTPTTGGTTAYRLQPMIDENTTTARSNSVSTATTTMDDHGSISTVNSTRVELLRKDGDNSQRDIMNNSIEERLNQMGIIRQYEVLVAGHMNSTVRKHNIDDNNTSISNNTDPELIDETHKHSMGSGWIDLPLMRCYEYPPYMRVSTLEQQRQLLALDVNVVGKKLLEAPKASVTYYEIVAYEYWNNNRTLPVTRLTLTSMTGRTHQLNVHCTCNMFSACVLFCVFRCFW
jgi:23S rRNA-/tRNA-specific pseudouridylate synthase